MIDGTFRDRWVAEVFRCPAISDATRVMLLALAQDMDEDGRVEMPRDELAVRLSRHPRKVTERYKAAVEAGFVTKVSGGHRGAASVFQGLLPDRGKGAARRHPIEEERVPVCSTLLDGKGAGSQHPIEPPKGATNRHPFEAEGAAGGHPMTAERVPSGGTLATPLRSRGVEVTEVSGALFEQKDLPPSAGAVAPATTGTEAEPKVLTVDQRTNAVTTTYTDRVPLSTFITVRQLVKRAIVSELYDDEQIRSGLIKLADEKRPVTANTLRIAMEGLPTTPAPTNSSNFAPGSGQMHMPPADHYGQGKARI